MRKRWRAVFVLLAGLAAALGYFYMRPNPMRNNVSIATSASGYATVAALPEWAVVASDSGASLPPVGRSLFDFMATDLGGASYRLPFPFPSLIDHLVQQAGAGGERNPLVSSVLVPLGRSLQRSAAAPEFFRFPRAVVAFTGEAVAGDGRAALQVQNRLYVAYLEKANVLEVISYNEAAGRFEFQIVTDYREGGDPKVFYANRQLCVACHQNAAPLFARPPWDETNANLGIRDLLAKQQRGFYGIALAQGVDVAYRIDAATDEANKLGVAQRLWRDGCGAAADPVGCRGDLFLLAMLFRLSGERALDENRSAKLQSLLRDGWRKRWPNGLYIPNPDIPNRDPLRSPIVHSEVGAVPTATLAELVAKSDVPGQFEPLLPRGPLETWALLGTHDDLKRAVALIGQFLTTDDVRSVDRLLAGRAAPTRVMDLRCGINRSALASDAVTLRLACHADTPSAVELLASIKMSGGDFMRGTVMSLTVANSHLSDLSAALGDSTSVGGVQVNDFALSDYTGFVPRLVSGEAIQTLRIRLPHGWTDVTGQQTVSAQLVLRDDLQPLLDSVGELATASRGGRSDVFSAKPLRRAALMSETLARLAARPLKWCCLDDHAIPPPQLEPTSDASVKFDEQTQLFVHYCGECHRTQQSFPPNFLGGTADDVKKSLSQCAPRIFARLSLWDLPLNTRPKMAMPPLHALNRYSITDQQWANSPDLDKLRKTVRTWLVNSNVAEPKLEDLIADGYGNLPPCLPPTLH